MSKKIVQAFRCLRGLFVFFFFVSVSISPPPQAKLGITVITLSQIFKFDILLTFLSKLLKLKYKTLVILESFGTSKQLLVLVDHYRLQLDNLLKSRLGILHKWEEDNGV